MDTFAWEVVGLVAGIVAAAAAIIGLVHVLRGRKQVPHPSGVAGEEALPAGSGEDAPIALYAQKLADRERMLGADHPDTLVTRNNLAVAYQAMGDIGRAITLYMQNLAAAERMLGAEHRDTLVRRNNLAIAYQAMGHTAEAIALYAQNLAAAERMGAEHPSNLVRRNNLAIAYQAAGDIGRAITLYRQNQGPAQPRTPAPPRVTPRMTPGNAG